jgi:two-component system, OmpR family, sensor histidine kinase ChvG
MEFFATSMRGYEPARGRDGALLESVTVLPGQMLGELAHDARNMVTALELYCDLLEAPGVLAAPFRHYGRELRLVAASSRRLVEKLAALDHDEVPERSGLARTPPNAPAGEAAPLRAAARPADLAPAESIDNLATELEAKRNLLAALAGPTIVLAMTTQGAALPVRLTREDLTRVLVNLVKNSTEAMPEGGQIAVSLDEFHADPAQSAWLVLKVEDSGPGIPPAAIGRVFEPRFTTRTNGGSDGRPAPNRGLGLSITRAIVEAAGGRIHAANRAQGGARIEIELPVLTR